MEKAPSFKMLSIGDDDETKKLIRATCTGVELVECNTMGDFEAQFDSWQDGKFAGITCGAMIKEISGAEIAQTLKNQCPETYKVFVTRDFSSFQPSVLLKNGFSSVFALPQDIDLLKRELMQKVMSLVSDIKDLRAVKLDDVGAGDKLEFETFVFLPLNQRYVRFSAADRPIEENRMKKLNEQKMNTLFVDQKEMGKFYQYSAKKLRDLTGDSKAMSETERQAKREEKVRNLFVSIFDSAGGDSGFEGGRQIIENCQGIISNFVTNGASSNWYEKLMATVGDKSDTYSHASRVSTFAALFSIALKIGKPEDMAIAGLFHDLGMADVPPDIANGTRQPTPEELAHYQAHPERSLLHLKNKRVSVPPDVEKAILAHHESITGKGFPKGLVRERIPPEAQLLSFADQFEYLTSIEAGKQRMTPIEALEAIRKKGTIEPTILNGLRRVLDPQPTAQPQPAVAKKSS